MSNQKNSALSIEAKRQALLEAEESGKYRTYGENILEMSDEEVDDTFIKMMNFLSDARTHNY